MIKNRIHMFLAVCSTGSFSKAAEQMYITPSAVNQQIRQLERDLNCSLFTRGSRGTQLTEEGKYLQREALKMTEMEEQVRNVLHRINSQERDICVGTSVLEKCRLLYNLWVLYSEEEPDHEIRMVTIDSEHHIPDETDVIESVNSGVDWMLKYEFLEICRVPFGFGVTLDHPLARRKWITLEDLKGESVLTINDGTNAEGREMLSTIRNAGVSLTYRDAPGSTGIWESAFHHHVLLVPTCWQDILINMKILPCRWEFSIPYGIFYRKDPRPAVKSFLDFVKKTYTVGNSRGIVPVL